MTSLNDCTSLHVYTCLTAVTQQCYHGFDLAELPICYRDYTLREIKLTSMFHAFNWASQCILYLWSFISGAPMDCCPLMLTKAVCFNLWPVKHTHRNTHVFLSPCSVRDIQGLSYGSQADDFIGLVYFLPLGLEERRENASSSWLSSTGNSLVRAGNITLVV